MQRVILLGAIALTLAGCAGFPDLTPITTTPVCDALVGPIKYNTYKPSSRRFAGPDLAQDLSVRNKVGEGLQCPQYRD